MPGPFSAGALISTNTPSARKSPEWLAGEPCRQPRKRASGRVSGPRPELAAAGFGGILRWAPDRRGRPGWIELSYRRPASRTHVVLVGKGITSTVGPVLKPNDGMKLMKTDMAGGAASSR